MNPGRNFFLIPLLLAVLVAACNKKEPEPDNGTGDSSAKLQVTMHDTTGPFDAVNVEIIGAEAHVTDNDSGEWVELTVNAGIYNLLVLQNGVDTVIVDSSILPAGNLSQFRLILGTANTVVIDSVTYPLATPSAQQSGLKLNVHEEIAAGSTYDMILDFDANKSVVSVNNGAEYQLKPVIKVEAVVEIE